MKPTKAQIIFFGTEAFSLPSLKGLVEQGFSVQAVVTKPDSRRGRGQKPVAPQVKSYASKRGIPVLQPADSKAILPLLKEYGSNIGVLVAYGKILPPEVLAFFKHGIVNAHPSLLPKYRGPAPIEAAILNGDDETGVTLMQVSEKMDGGPIFLQEEVPLRGDETKPMLYERLAAKSAKLLVSNIAAIAAGEIEPHEQNESTATYTELIKKSDGDLNWNDSATRNERKVRAFLGWPGSKAEVGGVSVVVLKASVMKRSQAVGSVTLEGGFPVVGCDEDSLQLKRVKPLNKSAMDGDAFARGYLKD